MTDIQCQHLEEISKHIEVLLHASEAPLPANALKKHLSLSSKELKQALDLLRQRLDTGVLSLHETASGYRLQIADIMYPCQNSARLQSSHLSVPRANGLPMHCKSNSR